jgi:hypothetical protein
VAGLAASTLLVSVFKCPHSSIWWIDPGIGGKSLGRTASGGDGVVVGFAVMSGGAPDVVDTVADGA